MMSFSLQTIYRQLKNHFDGVCERSFIENAPNAVAEPMASYLVLDVFDIQRNRGTYRNSILQILVGVRNKESGVADITATDSIVNDVLSRIPYSDEYVSITNPTVNTGLRESVFTYSIITCSLIIKNQ